jgi:hypothetical protein
MGAHQVEDALAFGCMSAPPSRQFFRCTFSGLMNHGREKSPEIGTAINFPVSLQGLNQAKSFLRVVEEQRFKGCLSGEGRNRFVPKQKERTAAYPE